MIVSIAMQMVIGCELVWLTEHPPTDPLCHTWCSFGNELATMSVVSALFLDPHFCHLPFHSAQSSLVLSSSDKSEELVRLKRGSSRRSFLLKNWEEKTGTAILGNSTTSYLLQRTKRRS